MAAARGTTDPWCTHCDNLNSKHTCTVTRILNTNTHSNDKFLLQVRHGFTSEGLLCDSCSGAYVSSVCVAVKVGASSSPFFPHEQPTSALTPHPDPNSNLARLPSLVYRNIRRHPKMSTLGPHMCTIDRICARRGGRGGSKVCCGEIPRSEALTRRQDIGDTRRRQKPCSAHLGCLFYLPAYIIRLGSGG